MLKSFFSKIRTNVVLQIITTVTMIVAVIGVFSFTSIGATTGVNAASTPASLNVIDYSSNSSTADSGAVNVVNAASAPVSLNLIDYGSNSSTTDSGVANVVNAASAPVSLNLIDYGSNSSTADSGAVDVVNAASAPVSLNLIDYSSNSSTADSGAVNVVNAASAPASLNLIYYGSNSSTTDQSIINANPEYLVDNSPAGPWGGNANIIKFMSAGIKYFEYIDGGYEGTVSRAIPNDLQANLTYINAAAKAGAYGVFIDEVSASPSASALNYLQQLAERAHSLGLKVVFNVGVDSWSDSLMSYCDFINSSEIWNNNALTASQIKWASRTWFLTQGVNDATTAANLNEAAWSKGIKAEYVCSSYVALPTWLASYITLIKSYSSPTPTPTPTPVSGNTIGTVASKPVASGASNEYSFYLKVTGTTVTGITGGQQVWVAASTTDFPNLLTLGATLSGSLDHSPGWWVFKKASTTTPTPTLTTVSGNTIGTVANKPVTSGASNQYSFYLKVTSTTVTGITAGQQVWVAATTTDFPNLLTVGATLNGNLDHSLGWWVFKKTK